MMNSSFRSFLAAIFAVTSIALQADTLDWLRKKQIKRISLKHYRSDGKYRRKSRLDV